ncbi:SDR family NAD(P)-dependent oxidoreductase [Erythrobacter sp. HL-111]|uniref:SDR family NAD(P)-dependent oxidoreductase n=1 Tax=Erythrobacter sp. HL-111 TaxID=1798193 RepID=UPI0006DB76CE|nr:SDR family NAD(P)-dependent oxidoreductase [Erythrobacter sp. HL-111]KPP89446.1 MAG: Dehydrogenase [Erythrobacteraceae bacterium HL-111]SDS49422.1 NAD(P)-dependent dehydrogenase, short-chain alcohol dehydrogenase family [Erythrobacter sp. HL-111]
MTYGKETTTDEVLEGRDLSGLTAFITGGNSGLGRETGRALASKGAQVVLAGRDEKKLAAAAKAIRADTGSESVETIACDLADLASVRACTGEARERFARIDLLINNAGVMATPFEHTKDGFERQFGTNHLGHFALTAGLMPLIEAAAGRPGSGRIVNLSSRAHQMTGVDLDDPHFERREYDPWASYGQSKTANVLFTVALENRFGAKGIHAYAVHPGGIDTNLGRHLTTEMAQGLMQYISKNDPGYSWKSIPQGAATSVWAATSETIEGRGGFYCEDCREAAIEAEATDRGVRPYALDPDTAARLWDMSERMTGVSFPA